MVASNVPRWQTLASPGCVGASLQAGARMPGGDRTRVCNIPSCPAVPCRHAIMASRPERYHSWYNGACQRHRCPPCPHAAAGPIRLAEAAARQLPMACRRSGCQHGELAAKGQHPPQAYVPAALASPQAV